MNGASLALALLGATALAGATRGARASVRRQDEEIYRQAGDGVDLRAESGDALSVLLSYADAIWMDRGLFFGLEAEEGEPEEDYDQRVLEAAVEALYDSGVAPNEPVVDFRYLQISPGARGAGEGRRAVERAEAYARRQGYRVVMLVAAELDEEKGHPLSFWHHMGYAELPGVYDPLLADRIMLKTLWERP